MTDGLLLDTHIALWLESGDERLSMATRGLIDQCWKQGGTIFLSAVTAWEIALLVDAGRIELDLGAMSWVERFLAHPGMSAAPLTWRAAAGAYGLGTFAHRDPADRLLIATAIELGCPLVTHDEKITAFATRHGDRYGFSARRR